MKKILSPLISQAVNKHWNMLRNSFKHIPELCPIRHPLIYGTGWRKVKYLVLNLDNFFLGVKPDLWDVDSTYLPLNTSHLCKTENYLYSVINGLSDLLHITNSFVLFTEPIRGMVKVWRYLNNWVLIGSSIPPKYWRWVCGTCRIDVLSLI